MLLRLLKIFTNFGGDFFCSFQYMAMDNAKDEETLSFWLSAGVCTDRNALVLNP